MSECSGRDAEERAVILKLAMKAQVKSFTQFFP